MIKAEELRLGNLVYDTSGKVNTINLDAFKYLLSYGGTDICQVKPIPLTEEWLLKFGFEESKGLYNNYRIKAGHYYNSVQLRDDTWFYSNDESDAGCYVVADFKYVHQLQNLYFVLTGQELKIND